MYYGNKTLIQTVTIHYLEEAPYTCPFQIAIHYGFLNPFLQFCTVTELKNVFSAYKNNQKQCDFASHRTCDRKMALYMRLMMPSWRNSVMQTCEKVHFFKQTVFWDTQHNSN